MDSNLSEFGLPIPAGFDFVASGMQLRRLAAVGLYGRRVRLGLGGSRYAITIPVEVGGIPHDHRLDSVSEVSAVLRHVCHFPIPARSRSVSRRRAGELVGQSWIGGF